MKKLGNALIHAPRHLWTLVEDYRRARQRARAARVEHARVAAEGRYHLDGVTPHGVREDSALHDERRAALAVADSLVRHVDAHDVSSRASGESRPPSHA